MPYAAPIPVFFQFAEHDRFSKASMQAYANAANGPKQALWYPTGHQMNDPQALADRAAWLEEKIGLHGARQSILPMPR